MTPQAPRRVAAAGLVLSIAGSITIIVGYVHQGETQLTGIGVSAAFAGLAITLVTWANNLMPAEQVTGQREPFGDEGELAAFEEELRDAEVSRRAALQRGADRRARRPGRGSRSCRCVRSARRRADRWPRPHGGTASGWSPRTGDRCGRATCRRTASSRCSPRAIAGLVRRPGRARARRLPGCSGRYRAATDWAPDGLIAYSKVCTHAGCPVGPVRGDDAPAAVPVPPVDVRRARRRRTGLRPGRRSACRSCRSRSTPTASSCADGDFSAPRGPAFWNRP